jgi:hypothetical protein
MATSEILGLFTTPEQYQQNQLAQFQNRAAQEIQANPFQQAALGARTAGYQLGQGIGGALGGTDPQLQLIARRQQLASQLDPSDPQSYMKVAKMAADAGDQQFAIAISDAGRKAAVQVAQANRERQMAIAPDIQKSQQAAVISQAIKQYKALPQTPEITQAIETLQLQLDFLSPKQKPEAIAAPLQVANRITQINQTLRGLDPNSPEYKDLLAEKTQLERPEKAEPRPSVGSDREGISLDLYNKNYYDLSQTERSEVNKVVDKKRKDEAEAGATRLPSQQVEPKDWLKFSEFINKDPLMTRTSSVLSDAPSAIETIRTSTQNNFSSASLPAAIAKLTGEGKNMSNADIERYTRTGGLDERIAGDVVGFFTGKKTNVTKAQAEQFAVSLYRGALLERKKFIQDQAESTGYDQTPNYKKTIEQLDKKLGQFKLVTPSASKTPSTPAPKPEDEALINKYLPPKKP